MQLSENSLLTYQLVLLGKSSIRLYADQNIWSRSNLQYPQSSFTLYQYIAAVINFDEGLRLRLTLFSGLCLSSNEFDKQLITDKLLVHYHPINHIIIFRMTLIINRTLSVKGHLSKSFLIHSRHCCFDHLVRFQAHFCLWRDSCVINNSSRQSCAPMIVFIS